MRTVQLADVYEVIRSMTPKGVEHTKKPAPPIILIVVIRSMTPKGVEH